MLIINCSNNHTRTFCFLNSLFAKIVSNNFIV